MKNYNHLNWVKRPITVFAGMLFIATGVMSLLLLDAFTSMAMAQNVKKQEPYPLPAWSQALPVAERFVLVLNNEAVLDKNTGLVWEKSPPLDLRVWFSARQSCFDRSVGGQSGWRLPSIVELASLNSPAVPPPGPTLPPGHPFINVSGNTYWSATTDANNSNIAWSMDFQNAQLVGTDKLQPSIIWCVRGPMNADRY